MFDIDLTGVVIFLIAVIVATYAAPGLAIAVVALANRRQRLALAAVVLPAPVGVG